MEEITVTEPAEVEDVPQEEPILDPGQLEGLSVEEKQEIQKDEEEKKEQYSKRVQERIDSLTKKRREAEREAETLRNELESARQVQPLPSQKEQQIEAPQAPETGHNEELAKLKEEMVQAYKDLDGDKQAELFLKIEAVKEKMVKTFDPEFVTKAIRQREQQTELEEFMTKNTWYSPTKPDGTPNPDYSWKMSGAAVALERELAKTWTGSSRELLAEVGRQVAEEFSTPVKPKLAAVQSVSAVKNVQTSKQIVLDDVQRKVAHGIFRGHPNPEQEYIKLLQKQGAI